MNALLFIPFSLLILASHCFAESAEDERQYDIQQEKTRRNAIRHIPTLIEQYATTLGCNFNLDPANVVRHEISNQEIYVALYSLDRGCSGGSAMATTSLVVLEWSESYPRLYISPSLSRLQGDFPATIDKLFIKNGQLWYSALWLQPRDALCCPSGKEVGQLVFKEGAWRKAGNASGGSFKANAGKTVRP